MLHVFARILDRIAAWLERVLGGGTPELVPVPVPANTPRRRR
ncbi:MAG TPA: hypothetical protein VFZ66_19675 [Herpetosiphonaceae bacterium]